MEEQKLNKNKLSSVSQNDLSHKNEYKANIELEKKESSKHNEDHNKDIFLNDLQLNEFEKELREAFNEFDTNKNGTIDKEEFATFMQKLGYRPTLVELQEMIDEVDKDKQGLIGFEEFKLLMTRTIRDEFTLTSSIEAFSVFDKQKTGKIGKEELISLLLSKGEHPMSKNEIDDLLKYVKFNDQGELVYGEFVKNTLDLFG
jgi:Ca2+-binding EF-hand superfamily protein